MTYTVRMCTTHSAACLSIIPFVPALCTKSQLPQPASRTPESKSNFMQLYGEEKQVRGLTPAINTQRTSWPEMQDVIALCFYTALSCVTLCLTAWHNADQSVKYIKRVMHLDFLLEKCVVKACTYEKWVFQTTTILKQTKFQLFSSSVGSGLYAKTVNLLRDIYKYDLMQQTEKKKKKITERSIFDLDIEVIACSYSIKGCFLYWIQWSKNKTNIYC